MKNHNCASFGGREPNVKESSFDYLLKEIKEFFGIKSKSKSKVEK